MCCQFQSPSKASLVFPQLDAKGIAHREETDRRRVGLCLPSTFPERALGTGRTGGHGDRWPPAALGADAHVGAPACPQDPEPKPDPPTLTQRGAPAQASRRLSCPERGSMQATRGHPREQPWPGTARGAFAFPGEE